MYRAGELDQKITFKRESRVPDGQGGFETTLADLAVNIWSKVRPISGKETERFDKLNATETTLFVTRKRTDIKENDTIEWSGVKYNIRHIARETNRKLYTEFYAERGVAI